jgi:hypothetical protein
VDCRKRNLILTDASSMPYFTDMRVIFDALPGVCVRYDWLISDLERLLINDNGIPEEKREKVLSL